MDLTQQIEQAKRYYRQGNLTIWEISNLTNLSKSKIYSEIGKAIKAGELQARQPDKVFKPIAPKGQGKERYYIPTGKPRGRKPNPDAKRRLRYTGEGQGNRKNHPEKFTEAQKQEIAKDYYENGLTWAQLQAKWGIHSPQMQRIRNSYGKAYGQKPFKPKNQQKKEVIADDNGANT